MAINPGMSSSSVYMLPGQTVKIKALQHWVSQHDQVKHEHLDGKITTRSLVRGFVSDNEETGSVEETKENEPAILYHHKKFAENVITFYARTGEMGKVFVISVPIHDHSSIVTGGPAYGTYFVDDELQENQEEKGG